MQTTVFNHSIGELPKMKNCRVDHKQMFGKTCSFLVNQESNEAYYFEFGVLNLKSLYAEFKFAALNELAIDTLCYMIGVDISRIEGVQYR